MDKTSKLQFQQDVEKYLEDRGIYDLFEELMKDLIINKPINPLDHLINKLDEPDQKIIFVVGPPGSHVREFALELSNQLENKNIDSSCYSVGELLIKQIENKLDLGYEIRNQIKLSDNFKIQKPIFIKNSLIRDFKYADDKIVIDIVLKKINEIRQEARSKNQGDKLKSCIILEGFPKTRVQGLALQKKGIIPSSFLICEVPNQNGSNSDQELVQFCLKKLESNQKNLYDHITGQQEKERYARNHAQEYKLHIEQVKEIYNQNYFSFEGLSLSVLNNINNSETDIFKNNDQAMKVVEDMNKLVKFKIDYKAPRRPQRILIASPSSIQSAALSSLISKKFGLVHVSSRQLVLDQIQKQTDVGKGIQAAVQKGEFVKDPIIQGLLEIRINKVDARIQGYVLDGYPRNSLQIETLNQMSIKPTLVVILEAGETYIDRENKTRADRVSTKSSAQIMEQWKNLEDLIAKHCDQYKIKKVKLNLEGERIENILEQVSLHLDQ